MIHRKRRLSEHGFTLLEILVACAIAAIAVGVTLIRLDPSDGQRLRTAAEKLTNRLEGAHNEAVTRGQSVSFSTDGQGYQFWIADTERNAWIALPDTDSVTSARFPRGIVLNSLHINGLPRPLGERLTFSSSGLTEVFVLTLSTGALTLNITGDALGRIETGHVH